MVDLPTVPDRIVTSTAPTSSVSRSDIIGQTDAMAGAIGKVADATMDIATKMAKDQAATDLQNQKVTLNADGSVNVVNPANSLIFGRAGELYHASVAAGTIAQHSNVISTEMNDLHQKYPTDPASFNVAADKFKATYLQDHGGGEVGMALRQQADSLQTQHGNAITNTAGQIDLRRQDSSLTAAQTSAHDDVLTMLRGGASKDDPAVQSRIAQFDATTEARAANPLFAYSKEQAQLDRETFHGEAAASRMLYNTDQIYNDQGPNGGKNAAIKYAEDILTNPGYKLSPQQREQYYHKAVGEIRANEAIRKQDIGEARAAFSELSLRSAAGARIESDEVEQVANGFRAAGDPGSAARVYSSFIRKPLNDDFGRQPLATQTQQLTALQGANAAAAAHKFFVGKGYTPEQSAGIVGNLVHESGMNPSAPGDGGTSGGLAQFHNERLTALRAFAAERGKPATDFQTQLEFIDKELRGGKAGINSNLAAADAALKMTPEEKNLYQRHVTNLTGPGGVDNPDGSRSTLYQSSVEHDGKTYNIPTVWDGKILPIDQAVKRVEKEGWDKFPAYKNAAEAEARYQQMHSFMDKDTTQYFQPGSEGATFRKLQGAKTPEQAAAAFIDYERPKGWTPENPAGGLGYQSRQNFARAVLNGRPADASMGPAGSAWLAANRKSTVDDAATAQWKTVMADYTKEGTRPALKSVNDIVNAARATGNAALLETIAHDAERMDLSGEFGRKSLPEQAAAITTMAVAGEKGELSPAMSATQKDLQRVNDTITKGLEENPIATTVTKFPDKFKSPGPLDFSSADSLAAGLKARSQIAQFAANNWKTPALSVLDQQDVKQLQGALEGPQGAGVLATISTALKPDEMERLLGEKGFKDSLTAMQSSLDPVKMSTANAVADKLWQQNAALAEQSLGKQSINKLQAWQALKGSFGAPELAKLLNQSDDPAFAKARADATTAAEKETKTLTPSDMAYKMGSGSWLLGRITGNTPDVPTDALTGSALINDYKATYTQLRTMGVPADKASDAAVKRLGATWGPSEAAGNQIMRLPPEHYNRPIEGAPNWIGEQLQDFVTASQGPAIRKHPDVPGKGSSPRQSWSISGLVADARTEGEVSNGQPPSYHVAIKRGNGDIDVLPDRITFDASKYLAQHEQQLRGKLSGIDAVRTGSTGMPQP